MFYNVFVFLENNEGVVGINNQVWETEIKEIQNDSFVRYGEYLYPNTFDQVFLNEIFMSFHAFKNLK